MIRPAEYNVVVTAAAPFKGNKTNPTQDVKLKLPDRIEREGRIPIKIIKFHTDFRNVITDMDIIPKLWSGEKKVYEPDSKEGEEMHVHAMLHLGMHKKSSWKLETRARRDGYDWVGDDGVPLPKHNGGKGERWEGLPEVLEPTFDVEKMVEGLQISLPQIPTEPSTDGGLLYCEFIFYTSLSTLYRRRETPRAMFLHHIADKSTPDGIEEGAKVAVSTISQMIDQLEASDAPELKHN